MTGSLLRTTKGTGIPQVLLSGQKRKKSALPVQAAGVIPRYKGPLEKKVGRFARSVESYRSERLPKIRITYP